MNKDDYFQIPDSINTSYGVLSKDGYTSAEKADGTLPWYWYQGIGETQEPDITTDFAVVFQSQLVTFHGEQVTFELIN